MSTPSFADDTLLFLKSYASLNRAWELIALYANATAMQINVKKMEGIRCGKLKSKPHVISKDLKTDSLTISSRTEESLLASTLVSTL